MNLPNGSCLLIIYVRGVLIVEMELSQVINAEFSGSYPT